MAKRPTPKDTIEISWGRFHAHISGPRAMLAIFGLAAVILIGRALHLW